MASSAGRNGSRWRKARAQALARDGHACQIRGAKCTGIATTADHIVTRQQCLATGLHGTRACRCDDPTNLRAACGPCNTARGNRTRKVVIAPPAPRHTRQW